MAINWKEDYQRYKNLFWKNYQYYKKREDIKNYVELILSLIAIIIFSIFAIKPTAITIIELNKEIKAKQDTIQKMNIKINNLQKAQQFINQEQDSINLINKAIPTKPEAESFIHTLAGIATLNNVSIKSINTESITIIGQAPQAKKSTLNLPEGTNMITFSSSFSGRFDDLNEFIKKLENFIRPLTFEELSIIKPKSKEGETQSDKLDLNVTIRVPYYQTINLTQKEEKTINQKDNLITK